MAWHWSEDVDWIWVPRWNEMKEAARIVQFRQTFTLGQAPDHCLINVSADTRYRLYVNGKSVCFGPAKSHLGEWNYESIDIAPFCTAGRNVIAVRVLRYSPLYAGNMSLTRGIIPGFILHCEDVVSYNSTPLFLLHVLTNTIA